MLDLYRDHVFIAVFFYWSRKKIYALYQTELGPVTKWVTIAASRPGAAPPTSFDDAMATPTAQEFVFVSCLDPSICSFDTTAVLTTFSTKPSTAQLSLTTARFVLIISQSQ